MARQSSDKSKPTPGATGREARLKAALKANLARRKAQARARAAEDDTQAPDDSGQEA